MKPREQMVIEMLHQRSHAAEDDPEDYVFLSLTKQEVYLLLLGACITAVSLRCLEDRVVDFELKVGETIYEQKPEWRGESDDDA